MSEPKPECVMLLSEKQRAMLCASEPDDITGEEGCGVELLTGADYAVAKSLKHRGFGYVTGPGGSLPGMYWSNSAGLEQRSAEALPCEGVEP